MLPALLLLSQATTLDKPVLDLVDSVSELDDRAVHSLTISNYRDLRKLVVADDGNGIYRTTFTSYIAGDGMRGFEGFSIARADQPEPEWLMKSYVQEWFLVKEPKTELVHAWDGQNNKLKRHSIEQVVRAKEKGVLVLSYGDGDAGALVELPLRSDTASAKVLNRATNEYGYPHVVADLSSNSYWIEEEKTVGEKLLTITRNQGGFHPLGIDSKRNVMLGYTYGEHGGAVDLALRPLNEFKLSRLRNDSSSSMGLWYSAMLTHDGKVLASRGEELLLWEGQKWRDRLEGYSSNGRWILISHASQRKSWLARLK